MARRCASGCSAKSSSRFATPTAGSASSTNSARIAAPRCGSGATRNRGLRCIYHGWKFDVDGKCVDQMNEPRPFCDKIRLTAYPTVEMGGVVWAYMGPTRQMPAPPDFEWTQVPETHRAVTQSVGRNATGSRRSKAASTPRTAPILHRTITPTRSRPASRCRRPFVRGAGAVARGRRHRLRLSLFRHPAARRRQDLCPRLPLRHAVHAAPPASSAAQWQRHRTTRGHIWVPIDDENCMVWNFDLQLWRRADRPTTTARSAATPMARMSRPGTSFRSFRNRQQLDDRPPDAEDRDLYRHRRHQHRRTARCRKAWGRSSIARASIWGRPTAR